MIREKTPRERFELPIPKGVLFESTALPDFTPCAKILTDTSRHYAISA
jgi:hypothetical protein